MASIDWKVVDDKINAYLYSYEGEEEIAKIVDKVMLGQLSFKKNTDGSSHTIQEAADKFIQVLVSDIYNSGLSDYAIDVITQNIDFAEPFKRGDNTYSIMVYWLDDMSRPSLDPRQGELYDLVSLLNYGVGHEMNRVYGEWHGKKIGSKTTIIGAHFIEQAIEDFLGNYGTEYGVDNITVLEDVRLE